MPGLRIFISSTMRDLANERHEVCRKLEEFNFAPVNAEGLLPTGASSWDRLVPEIESSDLFVLILGASYGWIPDSGPKASESKSVTELELEVAKTVGVPVLVFTKRLDLDTPTDTDDARRRDAFRRTVLAWDGGWFRGEFELASDLASKVGQAVVELISDKYRNAALIERRATRSEPKSAPPPAPPALSAPPAMPLPRALVIAIADGSAVLLLGSGASLQAGAPSAAAFVEAMVDRMRDRDETYVPPVSGTLHNAIATDYSLAHGDAKLRDLARQLVDPPWVGAPTAVHRAAALLFDTVLTTNYDLLLDRAMHGRGARIISDEPTTDDLAAPVRVIKLNGSVDDPSSLVLTESELANLEASRPALWRALRQLLATRPLLSIGSSLRDPNLIRLFESCLPSLRGWAIMRDVSEVERMRLARWGLEVIQGDASSVLERLKADVRRERHQL